MRAAVFFFRSLTQQRRVMLFIWQEHQNLHATGCYPCVIMLAAHHNLYHLPGFYEPFNAVSHIIATLIFAYLGIKLIRYCWPCRKQRLFVMIYAFACVFLLSMSSVFHMMVRGGTASAVMERLDHGGIFILIAGTFTAVHGIVFRGLARWVPLIVVWCFTAACVTLKTVFFESLPEWVGLSFYLGLGWGVALTAIPIFRRHGFWYLAPLFAGGIAYSIGAFMEFNGWFVMIPGVVQAHEIWHLAVLAGALLHWRFVWNVVNDPRYATGAGVGMGHQTRLATSAA